MSRKVPIPRLGVFGQNLSRELSLFESRIATKFQEDDKQEWGPLRYLDTATSTVRAEPWDIVSVNPSAGALTVVLPPASAFTVIGSWIGVKNDSDSTNAITVRAIIGTIDGAANFTLNTIRRFQWFYSTGFEWKAGPSSVADSNLEIRATISADQNNYNPIGWSSARYVYLNVTANSIITGMSANVSQLRKTIIHVGTEEVTLGFYEEHTASTAANRIRTPTPNDIYMLKNWAQDIYYDRTDSRWRFV